MHASMIQHLFLYNKINYGSMGLLHDHCTQLFHQIKPNIVVRILQTLKLSFISCRHNAVNYRLL